jgi:hypothetical protein
VTVRPLDTSLSAGAKLAGRYIVEEPISTGGMGAVYAARRQTGERVALKRLLDARHAARFEVEARLLAQLRHPRVVRVLDHFRDETGMYLVMELVEGTDLGQLLATRGKPGLPVSDAVQHIREACDALAYVHQQQIVHRDVKPSNLILGAKGVVVVDFGVAREVAGRDQSATVGIGTPRFMAPEVFAGGSVSARSDVFGLAATLWTLISGSAPAYGDSTPLAGVVDGVTEQLEAAIRAGLELSPERRLSSVTALAGAIGAPLGELTGASLALSVPGPTSSRDVLEAVVRTAAGVFDAASVSIALEEPATGELSYRAAWGAGAEQIVGVRLPLGAGIAGAVAKTGQEEVVPDCKQDPRFAAGVAAGTGYVPNTMLVVPLRRDGRVVGVLSVLDRRDGGPYGPNDVARARLFSELAVSALALGPPAGRKAPEDLASHPTLAPP